MFNPQGHVVMNTQPPSIYQRVIDKTKALAFQSQFIAQNIDKRLSAHTAAIAAAPIPTPVMVNTYIIMWQSCIEIEDYFIVYFDHISEFKVPCTAELPLRVVLLCSS